MQNHHASHLPADRSGRNTAIIVTAVLAAALAFRLALVPLLRYRPTHDLRIFVSWAHLLMTYGNRGLYEHRDSIDHFPVNYPPLFALILRGVVRVYESLVHGGDNAVLLGMLLKLPAIAADIVACVCIFLIVRRWASDLAAIGALAVAAFAPSTWPISVLWGQVDSICTAFMLVALLLSFQRRYTLAWCTLALAVLVKPLPIVVAPLLAVAQYRQEGWSLRLFVGPAAAIGVAYALSLPFAPTAAPAGTLRWLLSEYAVGQSLTDSTSVNAYNLWTLAWPVTSDGQRFLGVPLHAWGWTLFVAMLLPTAWQVYRRFAAEGNRGERERLVVRAWFVTLVALYMLQTRMHERYILFALTLVPLMWFCGQRERIAAVTLLVSFTISVILILGFYEHGWLPELPVITHLLSLVNAAAFVMALVALFDDPRNERRNRIASVFKRRADAGRQRLNIPSHKRLAESTFD